MSESPISKLMQFISTYESDTFSAQGSGLTDIESLKMSTKIMDHIIKVMLGEMSGRSFEIDGVWLSDLLDEVREEAHAATH